MIITRLHGRLGNQMFQYAAAAGLAARLGTSVALDTRDALRKSDGVLTRVFDLPLADAPQLPPAKNENLLRYALWRFGGGQPRYHRENGLGYNSAITRWQNNSYLHGYWQSEKYFAAIAGQIRNAFRFPTFSNAQNAEMATQIAQTKSIALHVRRGDYVSLDAHVLCDQAYYEAALARILENLNAEPTVFVFSDDPQWAKDNLPLPAKKIVVDFNGPETDFEDMRLMSLCQHNITANSSFSWWAAWLNDNPAKQVVSPASWFGDPKLSNPDILPDNWMKIET